MLYFGVKCQCFLSFRHLDLSYNRLRKIEGLSNLRKLRLLYFVHNKITKIEGLESQTELEMLELGDNRIKVRFLLRT